MHISREHDLALVLTSPSSQIFFVEFCSFFVKISLKTVDDIPTYVFYFSLFSVLPWYDLITMGFGGVKFKVPGSIPKGSSPSLLLLPALLAWCLTPAATALEVVTETESSSASLRPDYNHIKAAGFPCPGRDSCLGYYETGLATNSIFFCFLFVKTH